MFKIVSKQNVMKSWVSNLALDPNTYYELSVTDLKGGTNAQNKTFHGLLNEYQPYWSYDSWDDARENILFNYGPTKEGTINGITYRVVPSWAKMKKDERIKVIDSLITEMLEAQCTGTIFDSLVSEWKAYTKGV